MTVPTVSGSNQKKFKPAPTTQAEVRDCEAELTSQELLGVRAHERGESIGARCELVLGREITAKPREMFLHERIEPDELEVPRAPITEADQFVRKLSSARELFDDGLVDLLLLAGARDLRGGGRPTVDHLEVALEVSGDVPREADDALHLLVLLALLHELTLGLFEGRDIHVETDDAKRGALQHHRRYGLVEVANLTAVLERHVHPHDLAAKGAQSDLHPIAPHLFADIEITEGLPATIAPRLDRLRVLEDIAPLSIAYPDIEGEALDN